MVGKVIVFNGPPNSGKDLFGEMWKRHSVKKYGWIGAYTHKSFKSPLIEFVLTRYGVNKIEWESRYIDRKLKEQPWDRLEGKSQREALIDMSENVFKPAHGEGVFGDIAAKNLDPDNNYYFTDGGFGPELEPIVDKFGAENIVVVRLHREGYTFEGDSRSYIENECFSDVKMIDIDSADVDETFEDIVSKVEDFLHN